MNRALLCHWIKLICGIFYFIGTVGLSIYALYMMKPYLQNDYLWPDFTASKLSSLVIQIYNEQLLFASTISNFNIMDHRLAVWPNALNHHAQNAYVRRILHEELISIEGAIAGLRHYDVMLLTYLMTGYCWADLTRNWAMAHTLERQKRCSKMYANNGAVYLEAILRNVDLSTWFTANEMQFDSYIALPIMDLPNGKAWVDQLKDHRMISIQDEIRLWESFGLAIFQLQYSNRIQTGLSESIIIENALGQKPFLQLKSLNSIERGTFWTSSYLFGALQTDFAALQSNQSLVRNCSNFFGNQNPLQLVNYNDGSPLNVINQVLNDQLGQLTSIDLMWIPIPRNLLAAVQYFRNEVIGVIQANSTLNQLDLIPEVIFNPTPLPWSDPNFTFYGGNPFCSFGSPLRIVQESFAFDDACGTQASLAVQWSPLSSLFAFMIAPQNSSALCSQLPTAQNELCITAIAATNAMQKLLPLINIAPINLPKLSLMQFVAEQGGNVTLNTFSILRPPFTVFGLIMLYEWAMNLREAVSFHGDIQTIDLISQGYAPHQSTTTPISTGFSEYLWQCAAITTVGLCFVAVLMAILWLIYRPKHSEWFLFNRIVGTVWLNRSILAGRGFAALLCLVTSDVIVDTNSNMLKLSLHQKSLQSTCIFAGEVIWLTYICQEILHPLTGTHTVQYAGPSSLCSWILLITYSYTTPVPFSSTLSRNCFVINMDQMIYCTSGAIQISTWCRTAIALGIIFCTILTGAIIAMVIKNTKKFPIHPQNQVKSYFVPSLALPVTAVAFIHDRNPYCCKTSMDIITSAFCGLFRIKLQSQEYLFDTKLWLLVKSSVHSSPRQKLEQTPTTLMLPMVKSPTTKLLLDLSGLNQTVPTDKFSSLRALRKQSRRWLGVPTLLASVILNIAYFNVTVNTLANDYSWSGFNATGTYTFLGNYFNAQLMLTTEPRSVGLDSFAFGDASQRYNASGTIITISGTAAHRQLFSNSSLEIVIANLRQMDACNLPWVATQYCYLDFNKQWTMASTSQRQRRCDQLYAKNGAVYLESSLRNLNSWDRWLSCWGTSYEIGIESYLITSNDGQIWLNSLHSSQLDIPSEVLHWNQFGISSFIVQWQNYKTTGLINSFSIENALGLEYPLPISATRGEFHIEQQTSLRLYWTFASDLWAIATNGTLLADHSLLRESNKFAYHNVSPQSILYDNLTLVAPINAGMVSFQSKVGPFGNVDTFYILPPLLDYYTFFTSKLSELLIRDELAAKFYTLLPPRSLIMDVPSTILHKDELMSVGGRIMCGSDAPPYPFKFGIASYFGLTNLCFALFPEAMQPSMAQLLFALHGFNASHGLPNFTQICALDIYATGACANEYTTTFEFLASRAGQFENLMGLAKATQHLVLNLNISIVQYLQNMTSTDIFMYSLNVLEENDSWPYYGWCYLYDWASGAREVVSFQGDQGTIVVISSPISPAKLTPAADLISKSFSLLCLGCVKYITIVLTAVSLAALLLVLKYPTQVELANLMFVNRIAGMVWIGRPILLVRSLTAVWLLNTSPLELVQSHGLITHFESPPLSWYQTILAASELTWCVFIVNDLFSFLTQQYTRLYASDSTHLAWLVAVIWIFLSPQQHRVYLERNCQVVDMDFEIVCTSGYVQIGSVKRVLIGFGIGLASALFCYVVKRLWYPNVPKMEVPTLLLTAQCFYLFSFDDWQIEHEYFLDKMSAIVAGVLSIEYNNTLHVFDVKTWRYFSVRRETNEAKLPVHIANAIPLCRI